MNETNSIWNENNEPLAERLRPTSIDEIVETRSHALISVDGGINDITGKDCLNIGADVLVAGNYLFSADNFKERYDSLFK